MGRRLCKLNVSLRGIGSRLIPTFRHQGCQKSIVGPRDKARDRELFRKGETLLECLLLLYQWLWMVHVHLRSAPTLWSIATTGRYQHRLMEDLLMSKSCLDSQQKHPRVAVMTQEV